MRTFALKTAGFIFKDSFPAIKHELTPKAALALAVLNSLFNSNYVRTKSGAITLPLDRIAGCSCGLIGFKGVYDLVSILEAKGFIKRTRIGIEVANFPKSISKERPYLQIKVPEFAAPESELEKDELDFLKECRKPSSAIVLSFLIDCLRVHFMCGGSCFATIQNIEDARLKTGYSPRSFRNSLARLAQFGVISFCDLKTGEKTALRYPSADQKIVPSELLIRAVFGKVSTCQKSLASYSNPKDEKQCAEHAAIRNETACFYSDVCSSSVDRMLDEMRQAMQKSLEAIRMAYCKRIDEIAHAEEVLVERDKQPRKAFFKNRRLSRGGEPVAEDFNPSLAVEMWKATGNFPEFVAAVSRNFPEKSGPLYRSI